MYVDVIDIIYYRNEHIYRRYLRKKKENMLDMYRIESFQ